MSRKGFSSLPASRRAGVEAMEARVLLAAQIINDTGHVLANGTDGNDVMRIERVGTDDVKITINGTLTQTFDLDDVQDFLVSGLGGNDTITKVGSFPGADPIVTLEGGGGTDTITGTDAVFLSAEFIRDPSGRLVVESAAPDGLVIRGTSGADNLRIIDWGANAARVQVNSSFSGVLGAPESGAFILDAMGGNDTITVGGDVFGTVLGGDGNEFFELESDSRVVVVAGAGDDTIFARGESDNNGLDQILSGFDAGPGTDTLRMDRQTEITMPGGGSLENVSEARGIVHGNGLDNRITTRASDTAGVTIHGGGGDDTLVGAGGPDKLYGGEGDDTLTGNGGNDLLDGGEGIDNLNGGGGTNTLVNGENNGVPKFFIQDNGPGLRILTAYGLLGADTLRADRTGADDVRITVNGTSRTFDMDDFDRIILHAGPGNDTLHAGAGVAELFMLGNAGTDTIYGNELRNVLDGGAGNDTLWGNLGNDAVFGGAGNDELDGGQGDDLVYGEDGDDTLTGAAGKDEMDGGNGNDTIYARDGEFDNLVRGGQGSDRAQFDPDDEVDGIETTLP